jgi:tetratricopeptide (TPR) repeat protein
MDTPIHSIVLANANELIHRSALCNAYESMKVIAEGEEPCSRFDLETLFSISLPDRLHVFDSKPLNVSKVESGSNVAFHYEKKEYVSLMPSSHKLSSDYLDSFQKFLILQCAIHPEIRRQLLEAAVIPQSLSFSYVDNSGSTSVYYNLESAQQVSQRSQFEVPADYSTLESDESLRRILEELGKASLLGTNEMMKELEAELERDTQAGNVVEAVLVTQRYFLVTDDSIGYRKLLQRCGGLKDKGVRRVIYGLGTMDQLHDLMHKAEVSKSKYLGVVKYYMADLALGEHIEDFDAKSALLESLESDPFLVGAYVDLSRIYQTERDYYNAYRCLEAAKKINPTHSNLNAIKANELRLERDFKDWF